MNSIQPLPQTAAAVSVSGSSWLTVAAAAAEPCLSFGGGTGMTTAIDYGEVAAAYARHRRVHPEVLRSLLAALGPASKVLEVGCGTGNYLLGIRERAGCHCCGTDPSAEMLAQAEAGSGQVVLSRGSAEALDFPAAPFDLVFSVDVIHHVRDRPRFFREAARVLRPGGKVCTVTDSEWIIRNRQPLATYFPETVAEDLARYPTPDQLRAAMGDAGFVRFEERTVEFAAELRDIGPFRDKAYSCLRLISDEAFRRGLSRLEGDVRVGPIAWAPRYCLVWGSKCPDGHGG
jgi:SAM-dependent methyltransferase